MGTNKTSSPPSTINYPDLIGLITDKKPVGVDLIQCSMATRPSHIIAGQNFELVLVLQNASDVRVRVIVMPKLPDEDSAHHHHMFAVQSQRVRVTLQPAEVGYVTIPALCLRKTEPGRYTIDAEIHAEALDKDHKPNRVRLLEGGGKVSLTTLSEAVRHAILDLRKLHWDAHTDAWHKHHVVATFEVITTADIPRNALKGNWNSLWTMRDYWDDDVLQGRVQPYLDVFLPKLMPAEMIKILDEATLHWFSQTGYILYPVEALYISKILAYVLCEARPDQSSKITLALPMLNWYRKLMWLFFEHPYLAEQPVERIVRNYLYPDLVKDTVLHSFVMLMTVLKEEFGTEAEMQEYAETIAYALQNGNELTYAQVYLPLIAAGIIITNRLSLDNENITDSLHEIFKTQALRQAEFNEDNLFIVEMVNKLVDRSLEYKF